MGAVEPPAGCPLKSSCSYCNQPALRRTIAAVPSTSRRTAVYSKNADLHARDPWSSCKAYRLEADEATLNVHRQVTAVGRVH